MAEIIAVINQKGGVGKSTTAYAVGKGLSLKGYKILYIDLDGQSNLSSTITADITGLSSLDILKKTAPISEVIQHTTNGDIVPASPSLAGADTVITELGKEFRLKEAIDSLTDSYDYIIIDTPPALGILTVNALAVCTGIIIPAQADIYSIQGITQLHKTIEAVKQYCNPNMKILGIVLTRYNSRTILSRDVKAMLEKTAVQLQTKLYATPIRECVAIKEAQTVRQDIFTYAPESNGSKDYKCLVDEIERG